MSYLEGDTEYSEKLTNSLASMYFRLISVIELI